MKADYTHKDSVTIGEIGGVKVAVCPEAYKEIQQQKIIDENIILMNLQKENERLNNIINECLQSVCYIEHNLDKYEEIGLDHFDYAQKKTEELKEYLIEELKEKE